MVPVSSCVVLVCGLFLAVLVTAHNSACEVQIIQEKKSEPLTFLLK